MVRSLLTIVFLYNEVSLQQPNSCLCSTKQLSAKTNVYIENILKPLKVRRTKLIAYAILFVENKDCRMKCLFT